MSRAGQGGRVGTRLGLSVRGLEGTRAVVALGEP